MREHVRFPNDRGQTLAGHLYPAGSRAIILMAHGFTSDKSSRGRFEKVAAAFNRAGFDALAFDFSGCGESDDERLTAAKQVADMQAAIRCAKERGYAKIALYGHSLGSLICLRSFSPDIAAIAVSGALTDAMHYEWSSIYSAEQLRELAETGCLTDLRPGAVRETVVIDKQMLLDFEEIDQRELLQKVTCPVLIIHGNAPEDEEECQLLERSRRGMHYLSEESRLVVIEGATHSFFEQTDQLAELAADWFARHVGT